MVAIALDCVKNVGVLSPMMRNVNGTVEVIRSFTVLLFLVNLVQIYNLNFDMNKVAVELLNPDRNDMDEWFLEQF